MTREVIYIAGMARSGTTLLGRLLAERLESAFAGELMHIDALRIPSELCGCGHQLGACEFWNHAIDVVARIPPRRLAAVREVADGRAGADRRAEAAAVLEAVHASIESIDPRPVIDSSKVPDLARLHLSRRDRPRVHIVHILRDPSAVIASVSTRALIRPEVVGTTRRMRTFPAQAAAERWRDHNRDAQRLRDGAASFTRVHLEALVDDPETTLLEVASNTGLAPRNGPYAHHSIRGNPSRFERLKLDATRIAAVSEVPSHLRAIALQAGAYGYPLA